MLCDQSLNPSDLNAAEPIAVLKAYRISPELGFRLFSLHMDVRWFVPICRVEEKPVWSGAKNRRQRF